MNREKVKQLFKDREALKAEREDARRRGDMTAVRTLTAKIGNCTAKMNREVYMGIDEALMRLGLVDKP